jgi:hypothetical protein
LPQFLHAFQLSCHLFHDSRCSSCFSLKNIVSLVLSLFIHEVKMVDTSNLPSCPMSICLFFVSMCTHWYLFCTLSYNVIHLYFAAQIVPTLAIRSSVTWTWNLFEIGLSFCSIYFTYFFWKSKMLQTHLVILTSNSNSAISHFSKKSWLFFFFFL